MLTAADNPGYVVELEEVDVAPAVGGDAPQVEKANWKARAGEWWVVGGSRATVNTDFILTAAGMQKPLSGKVRLFGTDTERMHEKELLELRQRIGIVFRDGGRMFKHMTVFENVALPLRYRFNWTLDEAAEQASKLLELTGLEPLAHTTAGMIGTRWQLRVGLARALALKPEVLMLDDPLAGLEVRHRRWWLEFLTELSKGMAYFESPMTLILTTNDFTPWISSGRQFAIIDEKRWTLVGAEELRNINDET